MDEHKKADHEHGDENHEAPAAVLLVTGCPFHAVFGRWIKTKRRLQARNIRMAELGITVAVIQNIAARATVQITEIEGIPVPKESWSVRQIIDEIDRLTAAKSGYGK
ncbi:hypothetical protein D3C86_1626410 [compost metagenome]